MMKYTLFFVLMLTQCPVLPAQLVLQHLEGKKTIKIPIGSVITLNLPTKTTDEKCDCYHKYTGNLKSVETGRLSLVLKKEDNVTEDETGVYKRIETEYRYRKSELETTVLTNHVFSISREMSFRKSLDETGVILMFVSVIQSLAVTPFLKENARKTSGIIALGTFSTGLTLALIPNEKTYYLKQVKNKSKKTLWRIKS
ncbi:MAG: hypothetical protein JNL70_10520 [Saprospiraceae bacterium]|nr:hypothetical protein [Saprospiraceae bacterium]